MQRILKKKSGVVEALKEIFFCFLHLIHSDLLHQSEDGVHWIYHCSDDRGTVGHPVWLEQGVQHRHESIHPDLQARIASRLVAHRHDYGQRALQSRRAVVREIFHQFSVHRCVVLPLACAHQYIVRCGVN